MAATSNELTQSFNEVDIHQLDYLEGENLKINCNNSSDFIVGKQMTFNGPVTIINCDSPENFVENEGNVPSEERVVIRDKVLTQSVTNKVQNQAMKDCDKPLSDNVSKSKKVRAVEFLTQDFMKIPVAAWIVIFAVLFGAAIAMGVYFENETYGTENFPQANENPLKIVASDGESFNFFRRQDWGALDPIFRTEISLPVPYVVISHAESAMCFNKVYCSLYIRDTQKYHMSQGEGDIRYNFLVGGDGNIYEGLGWYYRNPAEGFVNNKSIDIDFIGDFSVYIDPTPVQVSAVKALIEYGFNNSYIAEDYSLIAANTTKDTLSPGINVYKIIKTWPHFDPNPENRIRGENDTYKETDQLQSVYQPEWPDGSGF